MKTAMRIVVPLLAVSFVACGGGERAAHSASSQADVPAMSGAAPPASADTPRPTARKRAPTSAAAFAGHSASGSANRASASHPAVTPTSAAALAALKALSSRGPLYPLLVTSAGVSGPVAGQNVVPVPAGSPFVLALVSVDSKAHTVILDKPTTREIKVAPKHLGRVTFHGLAPGHYSLRVDGAPRVATIAVFKPGAKR